MAKNKTEEKSKKKKQMLQNASIKKINKFNKKKTMENSIKKKSLNKATSVLNNSTNCETNNESVLELMTKYPELNQTFEYILYSNKYKHTLTDVFNIIKMLLSKLEELQKNDIDLDNIFETVNRNNKIKGLVESTTVNLSHVVEQLHINENKFLNFATNFNKTLLNTPNNFENATDNTTSSSTTSTPNVLKEPIVPNSAKHHPNISRKIKTENIVDKLNANIFNCKYTILLSDDEECDVYDQNNKTIVERKKPIKKEYLESYVIGSDFEDILSDHDDNDNNSSYLSENQDNTTSKLLSPHVIPVQKVKKNKPKEFDEAVLKARESDFCLRKRLNEQNNKMLNIVNKLNLQPHDIILEFDLINKLPLVTIHKELIKVLKKHQVEGIRFVWNTVFETVDKSNSTEGTGCILAHRMGVGKTLQIITLMYTILCHSHINIKTFLIICPPGLIYSWMDEIYKWLKNIDVDEIVKVYDLPKTNKLYNITNIATWKCKGGILILSYENFKSLVNCKQDDLRESFFHTLVDPGPDVVILDEGHYIKNTNTKLLKSLIQIRTKRRIVLTGTPMQNSLNEYYTLINFVKPNILGNHKDFNSMFIKPISSGQFIDSSTEAVQLMKQQTFILHKILENTIHRVDDKHLKPLLKEKIEYTIEVNMTKFQCELYEKFLNYNKTSNDKCGVFLRLHVLTLITLHPLTLYRLIHYKNSKAQEFGTVTYNNKFAKDLSWIADYGNDPRFFETNQSNKIIYLMAAIDRCQKKNEKILCFLKSPLALDAVEYFLQKDKNWVLGKDYLRMDGKTPLSIRNQMCEAFNDPNNPTKLFILSLGTGVIGYNMVGANRVLLLNTSWNPSNDLQAIYRCLRFGQQKSVYVNRLLAKGTVEPKTYYRQISKLGMASSVIDLQHMSRKVSYEQTNDLFTFDMSKQHPKVMPNTKDPVLNQLINSNLGSICNLKEHDSMLVESVEDQLTTEERKTIWSSFKNKELKTINLTSPKPPSLELQNTKQSKTKTVPKIINVKQEFNNSVLTNNNLPGEYQASSQNENETRDSVGSKFHSHFNNSNSSVSPLFTRKHTKFCDTAISEKSIDYNTEFKNTNIAERKRKYWRNNESIQNQFTNFSQKNFFQHKRYPTYDNRAHPFLKTYSKNTNQNEQQSSRQYEKNKNIQNRSGMFS